jgi:hypothetical protein
MPDVRIVTWNHDDASNNSPPPDGAPERQNPSMVSNCIRMILDAVKRWWARSGSKVTVCRSTAYGASCTEAFAWFVGGVVVSAVRKLRLAHQNKCRRRERVADARATPSGYPNGTPRKLPALRHESNSIPGARLMAAGADRSLPTWRSACVAVISSLLLRLQRENLARQLRRSRLAYLGRGRCSLPNFSWPSA